MTIQQAIENLDYNWLIQNEKNEWRKRQLIELFFDSKNKVKMNDKEINDYWRKEIRSLK